MPSYTQYKRQMAVLDADDSEIESWITVRGNHIPIMKGQSKGDAVKSFIEKKSGSGGAKPSTKKEYDPAFEIDRKNALANYYLYGGKYTQRSKQAAYKEWKHDTSSEENLRAANKWVNSELVAKQSKPSDSSEAKFGRSDAEAIQAWEDIEKADTRPESLKKADLEYYKAKKQGDMKKAYQKWKQYKREETKWEESKKLSKPSDSSKGGNKEPKKYPKDLVDMAHSVMAYGGFGMKPEDILNDSYHGQYLKRYTEKYGKELVLETLKEMASRIDRVDYNVYTGSEGETYNSVIWKAPQLETLPDEEWEATLKKLHKDRGSEKKLSKPSDASGGGKKANVANELDDVFTGSYDVPEYVEKMRNIVDKHYSARKVSDWERRSEGIQFFSDDTGRWGTTTEMSVDKELGDYILKAPSHRQEELLRYLKDIFLENDRNGGWQVADPRDILGKLSSTKAKNGKYTFQVNTSFYDMYHD